MTLPQVYELMAYWEKSPPLHLLVGACLKPGDRRGRPGAPHALPPAAGSGIGRLLALAPDGICRLASLAQGGEG